MITRIVSVAKQPSWLALWGHFFIRLLFLLANSNDDLNDENEKERHESVSSMPNQGQNETMGANEFVSDSYDQDVLNDEEIQSELKQLKLDSNKKTDGKLSRCSGSQCRFRFVSVSLQV